MIECTLTNPTGRQTPAHVLCLGGHELYFSYQTLVAFRSRRGDVAFRVANSWGPTTGRHFRELGILGFREVSAEELHEAVEKLVLRRWFDDEGVMGESLPGNPPTGHPGAS